MALALGLLMNQAHHLHHFLVCSAFQRLCLFLLSFLSSPLHKKKGISLNLVLAGLRLGLKNRQVGEKWVSDDCSYLCKGLNIIQREVFHLHHFLVCSAFQRLCLFLLSFLSSPLHKKKGFLFWKPL
jgi:uncharacterized membrane protein YozB (DUF420 family)